MHEVFAQQFWSRHPLGRPILGTPETVSSFDSLGLRRYFSNTYLASNLVVAAAGHLDHAALRALVERAFGDLPTGPTGPGRSRSQVVGVMPRGFYFPSRAVAFWIPTRLYQDSDRDRRNYYLRGVARLKPGVSIKEAQAEMRLVASRLESTGIVCAGIGRRCHRARLSD